MRNPIPLDAALAQLREIWGYSALRPKQSEVVQAILDGKDVLALLPTGGGKSICYQLPALLLPGITLVISPLIALMNDQVSQLEARGIRAAALHSGLGRRSINNVLDRVAYKDFKIVYCSPERLESENFRMRLQDVEVSLLAIDEAHCISQWGYDFRPSYRKINEAKSLWPKAQLLALTASATPRVQQDIVELLDLQKGKIVKASFDRPNIRWGVLHEDNKEERLVQLCKAYSGETQIVYAPTRRETIKLAKLLKQAGLKAEPYHAGLSYQARTSIQKAWIEERLEVVACTNAFGMGIDKADVRLVVHWAPPASLEEWYQEAGRAGRDNEVAYAILLYQAQDSEELQRKLSKSFPSKERITNIYNSLFNYWQLAIGTGAATLQLLDYNQIVERYNLNLYELLASIEILEASGYWTTVNGGEVQSQLQVLIRGEAIYKYCIQYPEYSTLLKTLLRTRGGILTLPVSIDEEQLSHSANTPISAVRDMLHKLHDKEIVEYLPATAKPQLLLLSDRVSTKDVVLDALYYVQRQKWRKQALTAALQFCNLNDEACRTRYLLSYFGEELEENCGHCDLCRTRKNSSAATASSSADQLKKGLLKGEEAEKAAWKLRRAADNE